MLKTWAINEGIKNTDVKLLCTDPGAKAAILKDMDTVGKEAQLRGFEFAKAITLVLEPFTMENDLLTPTYKMKRPQARIYFAKEIANMYAELSKSNSSPNKIW
uniref:Putative ovule protein n=1 Tax=Solanum chacoense TaxID=4108 RepID=A0A0V0GSH8_SOLCH